MAHDRIVPPLEGSAAMSADSTFAANVDRTLSLAFSLAYRILGDRESAANACETAYREVRQLPGGTWSAAEETAFLALVRSAALALKGPPNPPSAPLGPRDSRVNAVNELLLAASPLARRAIELCYFGGLSAAEAAELLEAPVDEVRQAMRTVLLAIASSPAANPAEGVQR